MDAVEPGLGKQPPAAAVLKLNTGEAAVLLRLGARGGALLRGDPVRAQAPVPGSGPRGHVRLKDAPSLIPRGPRPQPQAGSAVGRC